MPHGAAPVQGVRLRRFEVRGHDVNLHGDNVPSNEVTLPEAARFGTSVAQLGFSPRIVDGANIHIGAGMLQAC